jgi:hypothetical protein
MKTSDDKTEVQKKGKEICILSIVYDIQDVQKESKI